MFSAVMLEDLLLLTVPLFTSENGFLASWGSFLEFALF
jgi:hypothetical protein